MSAIFVFTTKTTQPCPQFFSVNGALTYKNAALLTSSVSLNAKFFQMAMVNYACAFRQSESGKYFEWIIMIIMMVMTMVALQPTSDSLVSPRSDVWETSADIPYWWRATTQIRVVLLIGWRKFPKRHDQSEALPRSGWWHVISMEFLRSFLRRHFAGKQVVASRNVGVFSGY